MTADLEPLPKATPLELYQLALRQGLDPDKLLLDLHDRLEASRAAKEFGEAITRFQALMPPVAKDNPVFGKDKSLGPQYHFADFASIMRVAQPILQECGIAVTFDSLSVQGGIQVTCRVRVGTHVEPTSFTLPMPTIPNANASQLAGAALSYAKRYSFTAALNIRVEGEDNDAQGQDVVIDTDQVRILNELIEECAAAGKPVDTTKFYDWLGCTSMHDMPASVFPKATWELMRKRKAVKK